MSRTFVWIDVETTGLDPSRDLLLEVAVVLTTGNLDVIGEREVVIGRHPLYDAYRLMDEKVREMHTKNKLIEEMALSTYTVESAETFITNFVKEHVPAGVGRLAGASVHFDSRFIHKNWPNFMKHLHYRQIDVSTIKELTEEWTPDRAIPKKDDKPHRAMADVKNSIADLKYYRGLFFK